MAAYDGISFLERQLSTILGQLAVLVDLYISVDVSSDGTEEAVCKIRDAHPNVFVVSLGRRFGSAAKNFYHLIDTVDVEDYDYVAFADQDDVWFPDKLSSAVSSILNNDVAGFSSDVYAFWPNRCAFSLVKKSTPKTGLDHFYQSPGPGCSQVFTSASFQSFQRFFAQNRSTLREFDYHDWLIYAFYRENSLGWLISDQPRMLYVQHEDNQIGANSGFMGFLERLKIVRSNWYYSQIVILSLVFKRPELVSKWFLVRNMFRLRRGRVSSFAALIILFFGYRSAS